MRSNIETNSVRHRLAMYHERASNPPLPPSRKTPRHSPKFRLSHFFSLFLSVRTVGFESVGLLSRGMEGTWQWEQRKHCHIILLNSLSYLKENPEQIAGEPLEISAFLAQSILIAEIAQSCASSR